MKWEHKHKIFKGDTKCKTCALTKKTWTILDESDKKHIPVSKWCSTCGARVTNEEKFVNFALASFQSLHVNCEKCDKKYQKYR